MIVLAQSIYNHRLVSATGRRKPRQDRLLRYVYCVMEELFVQFKMISFRYRQTHFLFFCNIFLMISLFAWINIWVQRIENKQIVQLALQLAILYVHISSFKCIIFMLGNLAYMKSNPL